MGKQRKQKDGQHHIDPNKGQMGSWITRLSVFQEITLTTSDINTHTHTHGHLDVNRYIYSHTIDKHAFNVIFCN